MSTSPLMSAAALAAQLESPDLCIIDCRFDLQQPEAGAEAYRQSHLPGARYAHLDRDLSGPVTASSGRHPLPDPQTFCASASRWGITAATQVVCYDDQANAYAARLWWLLRWLGHSRVAVLDGGMPAWEAGQFPLTERIPEPSPGSFSGTPRADLLITTAELAAGLDNGSSGCLLDVRAATRFSGAQEPIDPVAGHIPGARNLPYQLNLDSSGCYLPPEALRKLYRRLLGETAPGHCSVMCGSGVTACQTLVALELAGLGGARLYAGSWSEWIRDPSRAVAGGV